MLDHQRIHDGLRRARADRAVVPLLQAAGVGSGSPAAPQVAAFRSKRLRALSSFVVPVTLLFCSVVGNTALGDSLGLLGPPGLVSPDGFRVTLVRRNASGVAVAPQRPSMRAEGAEVRPGPPEGPLRVFEVIPSRGGREVKVRADDSGLTASVSFPVGPPAASVQLLLEPAAPVKGRDKEAALVVRLRKPDGSADRDSSPPVIRANVGKIEGLERTGPGEFRARYVLPETRYPEV